jgi:hypothetical protein
MENSLVDGAAAEAKYREAFQAEKEALLNWPIRLAAHLAAEFQVDEQKLHSALDREIRLYLADRSGRPAR